MRNDVFKVGDVVRVRDWDDMASEFETEGGEIRCDATFVPAMRYLCGREFVVSDVKKRPQGQELQGHNFFRGDYTLGVCWIITSDMVVYADGYNPVDIDVSGLDDLI